MTQTDEENCKRKGAPYCMDGKGGVLPRKASLWNFGRYRDPTHPPPTVQNYRRRVFEWPCFHRFHLSKRPYLEALPRSSNSLLIFPGIQSLLDTFHAAARKSHPLRPLSFTQKDSLQTFPRTFNSFFPSPFPPERRAFHMHTLADRQRTRRVETGGGKVLHSNSSHYSNPPPPESGNESKTQLFPFLLVLFRAVNLA